MKEIELDIKDLVLPDNTSTVHIHLHLDATYNNPHSATIEVKEIEGDNKFWGNYEIRANTVRDLFLQIITKFDQIPE